MGLSDRCTGAIPRIDALCRTIVAECVKRGFQGVLADFETNPYSDRLSFLSRLSARLSARGMALYCPLSLPAEGAALLVGTGLSGGSLRALLDNGEKVLLFAHHHAVMDVYKKELASYRPAFITGRETTQQKDDAVTRFMGEKTNLCVISLRAASGLNLQRASCVVFGELDWSPAVHSQAEDRAHRMGQKDSILCYYLVAPQGSDRDMQDALGLKVSQFVALMGDKTPALSGVQDAQQAAKAHIEKMLKQYDAAQTNDRV